jgi:hypothetical protein
MEPRSIDDVARGLVESAAPEKQCTRCGKSLPATTDHFWAI